MAIERWRPGFGPIRGPFRGLDRLEREMEDLFSRLFRDSQFPRLFGEGQGSHPPWTC
jgi:hypothetical protein